MDTRVKPGHDAVRADRLDHKFGLDLHRRMTGWVYFETNKRNGTIYTGVTNDLVRRTHEHREGSVKGFTKRYGLKRLVWFEAHDTMPLAIQREKNLKRYVRAWKVALIEGMNPAWDDLWFTIIK